MLFVMFFVFLVFVFCCVCFFFKQKTAYEMRISDWSSDVCSSDLEAGFSVAPTIRTCCEKVLLKLVTITLTIGSVIYWLSWSLISCCSIVGVLPTDRKSTRLNSSHYCASRMPSSA